MSEKKQSAWDVWKTRLPAATLQSIEGSTAVAPTEFDAFAQHLPPSVRSSVAAVVAGPSPPPEETCKEEAKRFGCVESENGEFSTLRMFRDADSLVRYLGSVEGEDKVIWCFYGVPLRFTRGPQRYLMLPDNNTALSIPLLPGVKLVRADADLIDLEWQEDGFVGPAYLASTDGLQVEAVPETVPPKNEALDDDEAGGEPEPDEEDEA